MSRTWHKQKEENYRGSRRFDKSCRSHGDCPHCQNAIQHKFERQAKQFHEDEYTASINLQCNEETLDDFYHYDDETDGNEVTYDSV